MNHMLTRVVVTATYVHAPCIDAVAAVIGAGSCAALVTRRAFSSYDFRTTTNARPLEGLGSFHLFASQHSEGTLHLDCRVYGG